LRPHRRRAPRPPGPDDPVLAVQDHHQPNTEKETAMTQQYAYFAEPIDATGGEPIPLCNKTWTEMRHRRLPLYSPRGAWTFPDGGPFPPVIQQVNDRALAGASAVVAVLPHGVPTVGVPMEIARAISWGIPVCVVADWSS